MEGKHEYWMFRFQGEVYANGPIDMNKPTTEKQIRAYIRKRYETNLPFEVWKTDPWWTV